MSGPTIPWPQWLALLMLALVAAPGIASAISFEQFSRRMLQTGAESAAAVATRKGMGWVITNFPLKVKTACDAVFYHSPLTLNITRPDRSSFCFVISHKLPEAVKYSCQLPASAGTVGRVQVLTAPGCGDAVASITVDGRPWSNFTYDAASNILSIDRIAALPWPDTPRPADHTVCIQLRPIRIPVANPGAPGNANGTCGAVTSFCAPTFGPDPACAVLVSDSKALCCPVNRVSYADAAVADDTGGLSYRLYAKVVAGCDVIASPELLQAAIATEYRTALGLPRDAVQVLSYSCRVNRLTVDFRVQGLKLNDPDLIDDRSAVLLKSLATSIGLVGVRTSPYTAPPPPPAPPMPPATPATPATPSPPPPLQPAQPVPPVQPAQPQEEQQLAQPPPASPEQQQEPDVPVLPTAPARLQPPANPPPASPSHYASKPPPVYGAR